MKCSAHDRINCEECLTGSISGCITPCAENTITFDYGLDPENRARDLKDSDIFRITAYIYSVDGNETTPLLQATTTTDTPNAAFNRAATYKGSWTFTPPASWNNRSLRAEIWVTLSRYDEGVERHDFRIASSGLCIERVRLYEIPDPDLTVTHTCTNRQVTLDLSTQYDPLFDATSWTSGQWEVDWGDGNQGIAAIGAIGDTDQIQHTYAEDGCNTIKITLKHVFTVIDSCPYDVEISVQMEYGIDAVNCPDNSPTLIVIEQ